MKSTYPNFLLYGATFVGATTHLSAQSVSTDPVGFVTNEVPANSDAIFSAVMSRPSAYAGAVATVDDADTVSLTGNPDFTVDQFAPTDEAGSNSYYILFTSGDREGLWAVISANTASSVDVTFVNQDFGSTPGDSVVAGDTVKIIPFWTPGTLFPDEDVTNLSELLVFSRAQAGVNLAASATYVSYDDFGWYDGPTNVNNLPIYPDESVVFRNTSGAVQSFTQAGNVPMSAYRTVLSLVANGTTQDIRLTSGLPVAVSLQELVDAGAASDGDQILIFNNSVTGQNKAAAMTAVYYNGFGWYDGPTDVNGHTIEVGQGIVYRKSGTNTADILVDITPAYQQ